MTDDTVKPVAAYMLTSDGSKHHLRFNVLEVERAAKIMSQRVVPLYTQAAIDAAVAAERERIAAWLEPQRDYIPATGAEFAAALRAIGGKPNLCCLRLAPTSGQVPSIRRGEDEL